MEKSVQSWHRCLDFTSLDQPIRSGEHLRRDRQADLLRSLEINHQLELRRLLDRQIGGLRSLQDSVHEICYAPVPSVPRLVLPCATATPTRKSEKIRAMGGKFLNDTVRTSIVKSHSIW